MKVFLRPCLIMPVKTKRKPSCACALLTCKGDKQATLEEPEPQPDSSFFLPPEGMFCLFASRNGQSKASRKTVKVPTRLNFFFSS